MQIVTNSFTKSEQYDHQVAKIDKEIDIKNRVTLLERCWYKIHMNILDSLNISRLLKVKPKVFCKKKTQEYQYFIYRYLSIYLISKEDGVGNYSIWEYIRRFL